MSQPDAAVLGGTEPRSGAEEAAEAAVIRKVGWRLIPLLSLGTLVAYLDRSNIGQASLTMIPALGMNTAQFGLAAGMFFVGYFIGELPSNLLQVRYGARRWICRIMMSWGVVVMAMAFVRGAGELYFMRLLIGFAEAGFTPTAILYLAYWFPLKYRTRVFSWFLLAIPMSVVIGAPISAGLLYLDGVAGIAGWQWVFLLEGLPAVVLGLIILFRLTDRPESATWLTDGEKAILVRALGDRGDSTEVRTHGPIGQALRDPRVWLLGLYGSAMSVGSYGIIFFLPLILAEFGASHIENGLLTTLPFIAGGIAMVLWGRHSDRTNERRLHAVVPIGLASIAFFAAGHLDAPIAKMAALILASTGTYMSVSILWHFVPAFFPRGKYAAAAIAIINMIGIAAGFVQPTVMGYLRVRTGSYEAGFTFMAVAILLCTICGGYLFWGLKRDVTDEEELI